MVGIDWFSKKFDGEQSGWQGDGMGGMHTGAVQRLLHEERIAGSWRGWRLPLCGDRDACVA